MKQLLTSFAAYDYWASEIILSSILDLSEEQQNREMVSSFPSIQKTCLHIWDASSIWWQRVQLHNTILVPSLSFHPGMKDIANGLLSQGEQWKIWLKEKEATAFGEKVPYKNSRGESFSQPLQDILLHLFNHGTYHRGQLVTLLRQAGVAKIPSTDFIVFTRQGR